MTPEQALPKPGRWPVPRGLEGRTAAGLMRLVRAPSVTLWAVLASRVVVLVAGAYGVLVPRGWEFSPLSTHLGAAGNALLGPATRFDAAYYLSIASHGYTSRPDLPVFFPLYPLLIHGLSYLTGSDVIAGVAISWASFGIALVLLHRLAELELGNRAADATVLLLAFTPLSFFFTAVYTESLFLLLSVGTIYAARRERWALAGILGALATLTRVTGILLVVPILIMHLPSRRRPGRHLGWVLLMPAALVGYLAFLAASGFSWLAPFQDEAHWDRHTTGPIGGIELAVRLAIRSAGAIVRGAHPLYNPTRFGPLSPAGQSIYLLLVLLIAGVALASCLRRLPLEYGAFAAIALMMCISSPRPGQPLFSLDRFVLTIFPLWMAAGAWIAKRHLERPAVVIGAILLAFYTIQFARGSFIA
jgi:hypothetical protein